MYYSGMKCGNPFTFKAALCQGKTAKDTCGQDAGCKWVLRATCASFSCPSDMMSNPDNAQMKCSGDKSTSCLKASCCKAKVSAGNSSTTKATCGAFATCASGTKAKANTTKCAGAAASTCNQATCCTAIPQQVVRGTIEFDVTLPTNVTQEQFLQDPKVKTGVRKGIAAKLGVNESWIAVTLKAGSVAPAGRLLATSKAAIKVDFTVTVPAGTGGTKSAAELQKTLTSASSNTAAEKKTWGDNVVAQIKAAAPTKYKDVAVTVKSLAHVASTTPKPSPTGSPVTSGGAGVKMNLVMMAVGLAITAA